MTRSENKKDKINILSTKRANLLPIRNVVIFPNIVQPLTVGREKSVNAIEEALKKDRYIVVATQKNEQIDNPNPEDIYDVGVLAEILQVIKLPDGTLRAIIEGLNRVRILHYIKREGIFEVEVELYVPSVEITPYINALSRKVIDLFEQYYQLNKRLSPENYIDLINIKDPNKLSDLVSSSIIINIEEKQEILSLFNIEERLKKLIEILKREIEVLELQGKIETEIKNKFDKTQKDFYLREQLKAIQRELGDIEGEEYSEEAATYKNKIDSINLPEEVKKIVDEELKRLAKMPPMMAEAGVVRNYLDWILALPWDKETVDQLDLVKAKKILDEDHYGLKDVKERILEYLAVRKLSKNVKSPILCLIGPPGVGKT
ncbi:MAG: LON peptidase substrate-binding domain-containing protein, partial [Caldisericia bacterium]|nr:LON peptidase substrate-binding domain-containing protein [Caldisericia bacterium]